MDLVAVKAAEVAEENNMKNLKIFLILVFVLASLVQVSAERYVNYDVYERIIHADGSYTDSTTPINDVNATGFVCGDAACSSVAGTLWNGDEINSGNDNRLELIFPTILQNPNGYGIYIYKDGYISWEQNPGYWGNSSSDPAGPYVKYLAKKEECRASVEQMAVLNVIEPNTPLVIDVSASLDATTFSAVENAGPLDYVPNMLVDDFYSVATTVTLEVRDGSGVVVYTESVDVLVPYSGSADVQFVWTPVVEGDYDAVIYSDITDGKCISSVRDSASSSFTVLDSTVNDSCYTILNDLGLSNQFPNSGDNVVISATKISNYVDDASRFTALQTLVNVDIVDENGGVVYTDSVTLGANLNVNDTSLFSFDWNTTGLSAGWYDISVNGFAVDSSCNGIGNLDMTAREAVYLNGFVQNGNTAPSISGLLSQVLVEDSGLNSRLIDLWAYASDAEWNVSNLSFAIVSQSDSGIANCSISSNRWIDCDVIANQTGTSDVTVSVADQEFVDFDSFFVMVGAVVNPNIPNLSIYSPVDRRTYDENDVALSVGSNDTINIWSYSLDGGAQVLFAPNITLMNLAEGAHTITAYAENNNGIGFASLTFYVDSDDGGSNGGSGGDSGGVRYLKAFDTYDSYEGGQEPIVLNDGSDKAKIGLGSFSGIVMLLIGIVGLILFIVKYSYML